MLSLIPKGICEPGPLRVSEVDAHMGFPDRGPLAQASPGIGLQPSETHLTEVGAAGVRANWLAMSSKNASRGDRADRSWGAKGCAL